MSLREELLKEHRHLEAYFERFIGSVETADRPHLMEEWTTFEKTVTEHFEDEEKFLFPALAAKDAAEAELLRADHASIRTKIAELGMKADLRGLRQEDVESLLADLKAHREREEAVLYCWADEHLDAAPRKQLLERLAERLST